MYTITLSYCHSGYCSNPMPKREPIVQEFDSFESTMYRWQEMQKMLLFKNAIPISYLASNEIGLYRVFDATIDGQTMDITLRSNGRV